MRTAFWILGLMLAFSSCNQAPAPEQKAPEQMTPSALTTINSAFIDLNQFTVTDDQEDHFFENGDEPYFVTIGFRSRVFTPNSTQVFWNQTINGDYFSGLHNGAVRTLPWFMNGVSFPNVNRVSATDIQNGQFPEIIGAITISFEHDLTSSGTITNMINDLQGALRTSLVNLIEHGQLDPTDPAGSIKQEVAQLKSSFEPSFWQKVNLFLGSFGNPDDVIGLHAFVYAVTDNTVVFPNSSDPELSTGMLPYGNLPLTVRFAGDSAVYDVSSTVRYVSVVQGDSSLRVVVMGAPSGQVQQLRVNGPSLSNVSLSGSRVLTGLLRGTYTVTAGGFATGSGHPSCKLYTPDPSSQARVLAAGQTVTATVTYTSESCNAP
jgi:hypothetical protein